MTWTWFHRLASPPYIYTLAARLTPWFAWPAGLLIVAGLWGGLVLAPPDYQQGDGFRIIYVHAPSAWMSLMVYTTMADRKSTRLNSSHRCISYAVFCLKKKNKRLALVDAGGKEVVNHEPISDCV